MSKAEAAIYRKLRMLRDDQSGRICVSLTRFQSRKLQIFSLNIPDLNANPYPDCEGEETQELTQNLSGLKPQNADYYVPQLIYELEAQILACVPCIEYWNLKYLNKRFSQLLKILETFSLRRDCKLVEPSVFMLSSVKSWTVFDKDFKNCHKLPELPSDLCFLVGYKESLCAGTHLLVTGREEKNIAVWRYEFDTNKWFKGPVMITPRIMFASASYGTEAFVAGGIKIVWNGTNEVLNTAEKYNAETKTWTPIRGMNKRRKFCSGCYSSGKFYVLGGRDENDLNLTCGESYQEVTDTWELIPDMVKDMSFSYSQPPPLIAVVNDNLYWLKTLSNELCVYDMNANVWKKLGIVPVRTESNNGWGVAFKSLGDRLLLIGASCVPCGMETMSVYTCRPSPDVEELRWERLERCCSVWLGHFIYNCCVMIA